MITRKCRLCGTEFHLTGNHDGAKMFCCAEHAKQYRRSYSRDYDKMFYQKHIEKYRRPKQVLTCKRCGNEFTGHGNEKYCTDCINSGGWYMNKILSQRKVEFA